MWRQIQKVFTAARRPGEHVVSRVVLEEVLEEGGSPLLSHVHLILQVAPVSDLGVFNLPAQVLNFSLKLRLLTLELKAENITD